MNTDRARMVDLVKKQHAELWSRGDLALIDVFYAEDFVGHFPGAVVNGREGVRSQVVAHRASFPDWQEEVLDVVVEGDTVVTRFRSTGTDRGGFMGNPPTGKRVEITEVCVFRVRDGKITEQWVYPDIVALRTQLGPML
jgi:steroid delta-isomerase-like uncharacterized protein